MERQVFYEADLFSNHVEKSLRFVLVINNQCNVLFEEISSSDHLLGIPRSVSVHCSAEGEEARLA